MLVVGRVDLRDQGFEARFVDHEVQMRGPEVVATGRLHQFSDWPIDRNWIPRRFHAAEMKAPGFVGNKPPAQIHLGLLGILIFIETLRRRMPDIDLSPCDGAPADIFEASTNDKSWAR